MSKSKAQSICFIKAGNVVQSLRGLLKSPPEYHYTLSSFLKAIDNTYDIYLISSKGPTGFIKHKNIQAVNIGLCLKFIPCRIERKTYTPIKTFIYLIRNIPNIVVANGNLTKSLPAFLYTALFRKDLILSFHGDLFNRKHNIMSKIAYKFVIKYANSIIVHGPYIKEQVSNYRKKIERIYEYNHDCSDLINYGNDNLTTDLTENGKYKLITYIGRIEKDKGVFDIFEAYKLILVNNKDIRLVFAGAGSSMNELKEECRKKNLDDKVLFLGRITRKEIALLLKITYVVVAATRKNLAEGRCQSIVEALAMGVPIIVPNYGAFLHLVEHKKNGLNFIGDDSSDLYHKLKMILNDSLYDRLKSGAINSSEKYIESYPYSYKTAIIKSIDGLKSSIK